MRRVQSGYERCADDYQRRIMRLNRQQQQQQQPSTAAAVATDTSSEENVRLLCCSFQRYLHCSEEVVNRTCGHETARFTKGFLDRMSGPLIQVRPNEKPKKFDLNGANEAHGKTTISSNSFWRNISHHFVLEAKPNSRPETHNETQSILVQPRVYNPPILHGESP